MSFIPQSRHFAICKAMCIGSIQTQRYGRANILSLDICTVGLSLFQDLPLHGNLDQWLEKIIFWFLLCTFKWVQLTAVSVMYPKICFSLQIPKGEREIIVLGWEEHSDATRSTTKLGELCGPVADNKQMAFAVAWIWSSLFVNYLFDDQCLV